MTEVDSASKSKSPRMQILLGLLGVLVLALLLLMPKLRSMLANAERMERESAATLAGAGRAAEDRAVATSTREEALRRPRDSDAQLRAAQALLQAGSAEQALPFAQTAAKVNARNSDAWLLLADLQRRARQLHESIQAYKTALRLDPDNGPALAGLASLYISLGWTGDVYELLEPRVKDRPNELPLKVALAMAALQGSDFARAEKYLLEVRQAAPNDIRIWSPLVHLYNSQKRYPDAERIAGEILSRLPGDVPVRNELGFALYRLNHVPEAMAAFRQALAHEAANVAARYYLALCHQRQGDQSAALKELEEVHRASPGYEQTRVILGNLYLQSGRTEEGRRLLHESKELQQRAQRRARLGLLVATKSKSPDAHFQLARLYHQDREPHRALVELHKTLELDPTHAEARNLLHSLESQSR